MQTDRPSGARDAVTRIFTPHRLEVLDRSCRLDARLDAVTLGSVTAGQLRYGAEVRLVNEDGLDSYHINVPLAGQTESWTGVDRILSDPGRAAVFLPRRPGRIRWSANCAQLCVKYGRDDLESELEAMLGRPASRPVEFATSMDLGTSASRSWLCAVGLLRRECRRPDGLVAHPLSARQLELLLIHSFLMAQPHNYTRTVTEPRPVPHPRTVRVAVELMEAHPEEPLTAPELAKRVGVGVRALQDGFRRHVGMPPMAYLREVRLARVREELLSGAHRPVAVAEVAFHWGFTHLGRFGVGYRSKFGETPAQTLRRVHGPLAPTASGG
ncbi:MAG TPA: AraC family transcriptional regulator [Mycobacterium sp.]|jgi:AraC-like DNA-binding protein|nr:AraC family transcriptional regulator [Mycobacterium sp.]